MKTSILTVPIAAAVLFLFGQARAQAPAPAPSTAPAPAPAPTTGPPAIGEPAGISPAPAPSAVAPPTPPDEVPPGPRQGGAAAPSAAWQLALYGFLEWDGIHDTTQSYGAASNNAVLARPGTYAGAHARTQMTIANSQLGLRLGSPQFGSARAVGQVEIDFFGVQPTDATEQTVFTTPSVRLRLFTVKIETPWIDIVAGQYHDLFGWGGEGFYQNSVAFLGVAGEVYHRNPQLRLVKSLPFAAVKLDLAVASVRPVQRDSEAPDVQAGVKVAFNGWRGATAQGFGQPDVLPMAIGLSGVGRRFAVAEFLTNPGDAKVAYGWGVAGNVFLPIIPARANDDRGNALSFTGEGSIGTGISDLYTGLTGGALFPLLPDPSGNLQPPPVYRPNIDSGIVTYDANGNLKTIDWWAVVLGLQYYLPVARGRAWVSATASRLQSGNILQLTPEASRGGVFTRQDYIDGNLFWAASGVVQLGLSYQLSQQTFGDQPFGLASHPRSRNHRVEMGLRMFLD